MKVRSSLGAVLLAFASVVLLALHQHLIDLAAIGEHGIGMSRGVLPHLDRTFYLGLPYRVVDPEFGPPQTIHAALLVVAGLECAVLYGLYRVLRDRIVSRTEYVVLAAAALAMLLLSLNAVSVLGFDLYAYAGFAKLGVHSAYAPPPTRFSGDFAAINEPWGIPMLASPYGPLWVALATLVAGGAKTLAAALFALRLLALVPFVAIVALLARRGAAYAALFALDPSMNVLYIANGHNDLLAVAPLLLALMLAARFPLAAAALTVAAGLMKLPFAGCALLVFAGRTPLVRRAGWVALTIAAIAGGSLAFGGTEYLHQLLLRVPVDHAQHGLASLTASVFRATLFILAALALLIAFARNRIWRAGSWTLVAASSTVYPWYLASGLVYAALERGALVAFLVLFPAGAALLEFAFPHLGLGQFAMLGIAAACIYELARKRLYPIDELQSDSLERRPAPTS